MFALVLMCLPFEEGLVYISVRELYGNLPLQIEKRNITLAEVIIFHFCTPDTILNWP